MARALFKPTDELRAKVRQLSGFGVNQEDIAKIIECSPKTLRKHFRRELDGGGAAANALISGYLFQNAQRGNVAAQIFWLKTRARWKDNLPLDDGPKDAISTEADEIILQRLIARLKQQQGDEK